MLYFFNIRSDKGKEFDHEGIDLPTLEAATEEAKRAARELVAERVRHDDRIDGMRFEISDESGTVVDTVWFRDVVKLD